MKFWILLLLFLCTWNAGFAQNVPPKENSILQNDNSINSRSRWDLVWRSAVLPGWGLLYAKSYRKGILTLTITTLLIGSEIKGHREEEDRKEKLHEYQSVFTFSYLNQPIINEQNLFLYSIVSEAKNNLDHTREENELKLTLLGFKYLLQLGYTYWFGISWEQEGNQTGLKFDVQKDSFSYGQNPNAQKFLISYDLLF